jgi:hypothetical protein
MRMQIAMPIQAVRRINLAGLGCDQTGNRQITQPGVMQTPGRICPMLLAAVMIAGHAPVWQCCGTQRSVDFSKEPVQTPRMIHRMPALIDTDNFVALVRQSA